MVPAGRLTKVADLGVPAPRPLGRARSEAKLGGEEREGWELGSCQNGHCYPKTFFLETQGHAAYHIW